MPIFFYLLPVLLAYLVFRAVSHYRAGRKQLFLITVFVACVVTYEILFSLYRLLTAG